MSNSSILCRVDSTAAISYINCYGGCPNAVLHEIATRIWKWCEIRSLYIHATYISSADNYKADACSRKDLDQSDWELCNTAYETIVQKFGNPDVDLFASHLTHKCTLFYSWLPDPKSEAVDAFTMKWNHKLCYAFPPFNLITRVLRKIVDDKSRCILVVPLWPSQPWFPEFCRLRQSEMLILEPKTKLITSPFHCRPHSLHKSLTLAVAVLSSLQ